MEFVFEIYLKEFKKKLSDLEKSMVAQVKQDVKNIAYGAWANINAMASKNLDTTRGVYLEALTKRNAIEIGQDTYFIQLKGLKANIVEKGWAPFEMNNKMLRSTSRVSAGPRKGESWVQQSLQGYQFANVPFQRSRVKSPKNKDMAEGLEQLKAFNQKGRLQKLVRKFTDPSGKVLSGKVGRATDSASIEANAQIKRYLQDTVKYQYVDKNKLVKSLYHSYRRISNKPGSKIWNHPGYKGLNAFDKVQKLVDEQMKKLAASYGK